MIQEWQQASSGVLSLKYGREQIPCNQARRGNQTFSTTASPQDRTRTTTTTSLIITGAGTSALVELVYAQMVKFMRSHSEVGWRRTIEVGGRFPRNQFMYKLVAIVWL